MTAQDFLCKAGRRWGGVINFLLTIVCELSRWISLLFSACRWDDVLLVKEVVVGRNTQILSELGSHAHSDFARGCPRFLEDRSEEHTSELQSRENLVCRLLLEKKKKLN